jgi:hypothetical protein
MEELMLVDEPASVLSIWRQALATIKEYPLAAVIPAAGLGSLGDASYYFIKGEITLPEEILTTLSGAFAYYLYIVYTAYAEEVTAEAEQGAERITMVGVLHELRQASPIVPTVLFASAAAIAIPLVATTLLVIPGLWQLTRWA